MKKYVLAGTILFLIIIQSCKNQAFQIEGTIENEAFNGEEIYLIPIDAPSSKDVDSTTIVNGKFYFQGKADSIEVRILRVKAKPTDYLQDLIVILEPGTIHVQMAHNSSAKGNRLNNLLQEWKENKAKSDSLQWSIINKKYEVRSQSSKDSLSLQSARLEQIDLSSNIELIKENAQNGLGLFLFKICYMNISEADKSKLLHLSRGAFPKKDKQLKALLLQREEKL